MSTFKVEVRTMGPIRKHDNADRLQLAKVNGLEYQFVVQKDVYKEGQLVVYFPVDSVLTDELSEHLGIKNMLAGKDKNRIKTVKLRGEISQGFVCPIEEVSDWIGDADAVDNYIKEGDDVTADLEVTKYEPEPVINNDGKLFPLPDGVPVYDIEGADRYADVVKYLIDNKIPVCITEKMEGTNFSMTVRKTPECTYEVFVNSKNKSIEEVYAPLPKRSLFKRFKDWFFHEPKPVPTKRPNVYWETARKEKLEELAKGALSTYMATQVTVRGELVGPAIQNNIYGYKEYFIFIFDILIDGKYMDEFALRDWVSSYNQVPILEWNVQLDKWLDGKTLQEASNGQSKLAKVKREGIVIKPMAELTHGSIGRLILKQRSPEYLAKEKDDD